MALHDGEAEVGLFSRQNRRYFPAMTATEKSNLLGLPADERAEIAELLLRSFDAPDQPETDAAWARESEDRITAFERGEITATDGPAAMAELRRRFAK